MNNISICGADIGNITSIFMGDKTNDVLIIESRLEKYSTIKELGDNEIFEIDDNKLIVNQGEFKNEHLKFKKDNFLNLLYYGISKVCKNNKIKLVLGIPAGQYNEYNQELKTLIKQNNIRKVTIGPGKDKITKTIYIEDIIILPESYGIKNLKSVSKAQIEAKTLIVDIGGGTTDIAIFDEKNKFIGGESLDIGLLELYHNVRKYISMKYCKISLEDAKKVFDGEIKMINIKDYSFLKDFQDDFMGRLLNEFKGSFPSAVSCNLILAGGGGEVGNKYFKAEYPQTILVNDIAVNAKAFRLMGLKKWQK